MKPYALRLAALAAAVVLAGVGAWAGGASASARSAAGGLRAAPYVSSTRIKHVVVIYLENESFDAILGFWCDQHPGRCPWNGDPSGGGMPASVTLSNGAVVKPADNPDRVPNVRHETVDQQNAINGGKMNGWDLIPNCTAAYNYRCVGGYKPSQEPNLAKLASTYAISDMTFSMQDSPSWFGHLYSVAASTDGFTGNNPWHKYAGMQGIGWGCDSNSIADHVSKQGLTSLAPSCIPDYSLSVPNGGAYTATRVPQVSTIMDRLNAAGLSWRIYGATCLDMVVKTSGLKTCVKAQPGYLWSVCPSFAKMLYSGGQCDGTQNAAGDGLVRRSQFATDAASGSLPAFSLVVPDGAQSEHNGFSMTQGDDWLGSLVNAVMSSRDWSSTAIFITWDDCGCFYDQVPPGTNPDGTPQGPRVPLVIVSPYARPGYTDTTHTTFAGILAYTEHVFGLAPLGANDAGAYDFSGAFNYHQAPLKPVKMIWRPVPAWAKRLRNASGGAS